MFRIFLAIQTFLLYVSVFVRDFTERLQCKGHQTVVVTSLIEAIKPAVNISSAVGDRRYEFMRSKVPAKRTCGKQDSHSVRGWRLSILTVFEEISVRSC